MVTINELNDKWRRKSLRYELRFYDRETGDTIDIAPKSPTVISIDIIEKNGPFKLNRTEWFKRAHDAIIREAIISAIDRYGHRFGVDKPPGENTGTIDFEIKELEQKEEFEGVKVPQDVLDRIERLEELIADSMKAIEEYEDMIADILVKKEEERTTEDRERLIRLDGYIRVERENIRKFENEINRLKRQWNIE